MFDKYNNMSTLGLSTFEAVAFPLIPRIPHADYTPMEMYHKVNIGTVANPEHEKHKVDLFCLMVLRQLSSTCCESKPI